MAGTGVYGRVYGRVHGRAQLVIGPISKLVRPLRPMFISLRNRLTLVFFLITLLAIGSLYMNVAPGLRTRLINERIGELVTDAQRYSGAISATVGANVDRAGINADVDTASLESGAAVTLLSVSEAVNPGGPQVSLLAESSNPSASMQLGYPMARAAARTGKPATGTESTASGEVAEAAVPVRFHGQVARVIVYSAGVSDVISSVPIVRHEILVAGGIALLLAIVGSYLIARWLALRVKRLERAAERMAAGEFEPPIPVDSRDELGELAVAFNLMQKQLGQLDRARKQFIATASHELRTPVFSLGGFVELLEDESLDAETRRRFLGHVSEQVERLRKLSVDLLDLSRLEAGALELRPEPVDLGELTRSVSAEFELSLAQHDSHLELRLSPHIDAVCDPVRIAQIVRILIDNALTHSPPGTRIVVTAGREDGRVRLAVRDDGAGVDTTALSRIFEPFFTADDAQGSGLGLAIASELAGRMEGQLTVDTWPGRTVFTLDIPA